MEIDSNYKKQKNYRDQLVSVKSTPHFQLDNLEQKFARARIYSAKDLILWLQKHKFQYLISFGELKFADFQLYRRKGKGRYHWRLYSYQDRIVVESHIDQVDPGKNLNSIHSSNKWIKDTTEHIIEDVFKKSNNNYILKRISLSSSDIEMIKSEMQQFRVYGWLKSILNFE